MIITQKTKIFKILFLTVVTVLFVTESKAGRYSDPSTENQSVPGNVFYDYHNQRELLVNPQGQVVPKDSGDDSYATRSTTFHEEYKPTYDPKSQRVRYPVKNRYEGGDINTSSPTVKPSWYDRLTTYNENQRRPWNPYSGGEKKATANVYYNGKEAEIFNRHYMQTGLRPVPYMYGSASLVMRKRANAADYNLPDGETLDYIVDPDSAERSGNDIDFVSSYNSSLAPMGGYDSMSDRSRSKSNSFSMNGFESMNDRRGRPDLSSMRGYESISDRGRSNQAIRGSNGVIITDHDSIKDDYYDKYDYDMSEGYTYHSNVMIGKPRGGDVMASTRIGAPKRDWDKKLKKQPNFARPGDFDYNSVKEPTVEAYKTTRSSRGIDRFSRDYQSGMMIENGQNGNVIIDSQRPELGGKEFFIVNGHGQVQGADNYTVETGDTLSEISEKEKIYGNWTLWPLIYDANRNQLNDPDLIEVGQNLDIPRDYTEEEESEASYRARLKEQPINLFDGR